MEFANKEKYENCTGIYRIFQKSTGASYIGQTSERFVKRYWNNRWLLLNNRHCSIILQEAFNSSSPDDFVFEVLEVIDDVMMLDSSEMHHIALCRSSGLSLNVSAGGKGKRAPMSEKAKRIVGEANRIHMTGKKLSEETRAKMRKSSKRVSPTLEHRKILSEYMKNRDVSDETREKIRQANIGSKSNFAKMDESQALQIKLDLMSGMTIREVSEKFSIPYSTIGTLACGNTWKHVKADGWDSFVLNRKKK